jgi:hypothetical protein
MNLENVQKHLIIARGARENLMGLQLPKRTSTQERGEDRSGIAA